MNTKHFSKSMTVQGLAVMVLTKVLFDLNLIDGVEPVEQVVEAVLTAVGFAMALWGRWRANSKLYVKK